MPRRFHFSLRSLLVTMLVVAAFFGGMALQKRLDTPILLGRTQGFVHYKEWGFRPSWTERIRLRDGTEWKRRLDNPPDQEE